MPMTDKLSQLWRRLLFYMRRDRFDRELEEEMRFHLEMKGEENLAAGLSPEEARYAALRQFGNQTLIREVSRDMWGFRSLETLVQDIRFGFRTLVRNPGFSVVSLIALALGIGASVAVFSVVNSILIRSLPYKDSDRLVMISEKTSQEDLPVTYPNYVDWKNQNQVFESTAAYRFGAFNLTGLPEAERLGSMIVSSDFLPTLGVNPIRGRGFSPEDDRPGSSPVVILSYDFWRRVFGADESVIGKQLILNRVGYTIIGITPAGFRFGIGGEVITPLGLIEERFRQRARDPGVFVVARLKPQITLEQSRARMEAIQSALTRQYPDVLTGRRVVLRSLYDSTVSNIKMSLLVLAGAVGFVLLIACANVANLLLARASSRQKEVAIRTALGASRARLIRQFLTESVLLSLAGGILGLLLAYLMTRLLISFSSGNIPRMDEVGIDLRVLSFALLISLLAGTIYGFFPALRASKTDLNSSLKEGGRGETVSRSFLSSALVVSEVALAVVLVIGGGLMIKTFRNLQKVDPGFEARNLLTMQMSISVNGTEGAKVTSFLDHLYQNVKYLPGVRGVAFSNGLPLLGANQLPLEVEGRPVEKPGQNPNAVMYIASADYFQVMNIRALKGRTFSTEDTRERPLVAVIDEVLAEKYFPGENPIGKRFSPDVQPRLKLEIIGIVGNVKNQGPDGRSPVQPQFYFNLNQLPEQSFLFVVRQLNLVVRAEGDPLNLASSIRRQVTSLDKDQPVFNIRTMEDRISDTIGVQRLSMLLLSSFAFVALVLAAVGIYGIMAYSVSQRKHDIGIRMALGAQVADILKLVIAQGMSLALIGLGVGLAAAFALTRVMSTLLYGVSATDSVIFIGISLLIIVVALAAIFIPARRATKVDPIVTLRYE
jgi:putative ABC transport system permease protein